MTPPLPPRAGDLGPLGFSASAVPVEPVRGYPIFTNGDSCIPVAHVFEDAPDALELAALIVRVANAPAPRTTHPTLRVLTGAAVVFLPLALLWADPLGAAGVALAAGGILALGEALRWLGL